MREIVKRSLDLDLPRSKERFRNRTKNDLEKIKRKIRTIIK